MCDANPFELACSLIGMGMNVCEIFSNVTPQDIPTIKRLSGLDPNIRVYTGISPSMIHYQPLEDVDLVIGKDASVYYPNRPCVLWNQEVQPFGYQAILDLYRALGEQL